MKNLLVAVMALTLPVWVLATPAGSNPGSPKPSSGENASPLASPGPKDSAATGVAPDGVPSPKHKELKPFPPAQAGMERFVIVLPHKERGEEDAFRVELIPGKVMATDGVNLLRFGVSLEEKDLKGWGYTYYEITGKGGVASTLIGVPPGTPEVTRFVSGTPLHIRYNSRLPIVIYAPAGHEIRYRIWKADETFTPAPKG